MQAVLRNRVWPLFEEWTEERPAMIKYLIQTWVDATNPRVVEANEENIRKELRHALQVSARMQIENKVFFIASTVVVEALWRQRAA